MPPIRLTILEPGGGLSDEFKNMNQVCLLTLPLVLGYCPKDNTLDITGEKTMNPRLKKKSNSYGV